MTRFTPIDSEPVLRVLNHDLTPAAFGNLVAKWTKSEIALSDAQKQKVFDRVVSQKLRARIDEWLKTGKRNDDSEAPFDRDLSQTDTAKVVARAYLNAHPVRVVVDDDLNISISKLPEVSGVAPAGFSEIARASSARTSFLFVTTLTSEWKHGLYKCEDCDRYYLVRKPRKRYQYGMFCRLHHQQRGSARAKRRNHGRPAARLVENAAKWLLDRGVRSSSWRANSTRKENLANHLNTSVGWVESSADHIDRCRIEMAESTTQGVQNPKSGR